MTALLRLLEPDGKLHPCPASRLGANGIWVFPLGFQSYSEERPGRVQILEVPTHVEAGGYGVIVDTGGLSAPRWRLEVTFGNKNKVIGGTTYTAQEIHDDLHAFLGYYFNERSRRIRERQPLIEMAFSDFYQNRHWIVVPDSAGQKRMGVQEPTRARVALSLTGVRPANRPPRPSDFVAQRLRPGALQLVAKEMSGYCPLDG